jgi:hypothetical protein
MRNQQYLAKVAGERHSPIGYPHASIDAQWASGMRNGALGMTVIIVVSETDHTEAS